LFSAHKPCRIFCKKMLNIPMTRAKEPHLCPGYHGSREWSLIQINGFASFLNRSETGTARQSCRDGDGAGPEPPVSGRFGLTAVPAQDGQP
jgi:hypothetical protein